MCGHNCCKKLLFSTHVTESEDNCCFYIYEHREKAYTFYRITEVLREGPEKTSKIDFIQAVEISTRAPSRLCHANLDLSLVGVREVNGDHDRIHTFEEHEISGKAIQTGRYIISIPNEVSNESY
jgi:hypothetical protein